MDRSAGASSTSPRRPSRRSRRSGRAWPTSASPGKPGLGLGAVRELCRRHGITPRKALGQHFLVDPNLARAIAAQAGVGPGDRVVEVGAGLGSLTVALAATGAEVLAVERDPSLLPALREVVAGAPAVRILEADAMRLDWERALRGRGWRMVSNLPYNVAVPLVLGMLERAPVTRFLVMVQREVGERLVAGPGDEGYGAVSLRVAYRAEAELLRRVPPEVFWPRPAVGSVLVRLARRRRPVRVDPGPLFRVIEAGFAERRKTLRNALRRMGLSAAAADDALARAGLTSRTRAEEVDLGGFARLTEALLGAGGAA
ncbi:MAG TPA: 16S rRNA (adenine(1518)-N(6)/adenine(1519)-N(6))-dimethyltransferase RsmA [Actinomycetota bacterium]|nr:16S rRNA (adenine(1518)-N(6)/adenine(1519)-N(6))-dimethyltransferase RsmA [Actinomycetota bacterium]